MTSKEAIEVIKSNYPPEQYTMLREALDLAIASLQIQEKNGYRVPNINGRGTTSTPCSKAFPFIPRGKGK